MAALLKFRVVFVHKATSHVLGAGTRTVVVHATGPRVAEAMAWNAVGPRRFWQVTAVMMVEAIK
jgi:hypothetical protein